MSPARPFLVAALLGSFSLLRAEDIVTETTAPDPAPAAPSQNVTINLINRLVQKGVLSQDDAADLIKQAEADAVTAAQNAAQMVAMDNATKNSGEVIDSLTLTMNKVRQAAITREIIEVVSGAGAL